MRQTPMCGRSSRHLQDILNDPKNLENTQLQQYVRPLIDRLQNPDGTPKITDRQANCGVGGRTFST